MNVNKIDVMNKIHEFLREAGPVGLVMKQILLRLQHEYNEEGGTVSESSVWNYIEKLIKEGRVYKEKVSGSPNQYFAMEFHVDLPRTSETVESLSRVDEELPLAKPPGAEPIATLSNSDKVLLWAAAINSLRSVDRERFKPVEEALFEDIKGFLK